MDNNRTAKPTDKTPELPVVNVLVKTLLTVLFSLFIPLVLSGRFSEEAAGFIAVIAAMLGIIDLFLGSASPKYPVICLLLGVATAFLTQSIFAGTCVISMLMIIADGAVALAFSKSRLRPILLAAIPLFSFALSFPLTGGDVLISLTSLIFYPASVILGIVTVRKASRVQAICAVSAAIVIPAVVLALVAFAVSFGTLSPDSLRDFIGGFRENSVRYLTESYDAMAETYYETYGASVSALLGGGFSTEYADTMIASLINLAPAILIISANTVGFLTQGLTQSRLKRMHATVYVTRNTSEFELSIFAPIVLLLSFALAYFTSGATLRGGLAVFIASENIFSVLEPALALYGLKWLFRPKAVFPMFIPFILLLLVLLFASAYFFKICAFMGAFFRIYEAIASKARSEQ